MQKMLLSFTLVMFFTLAKSQDSTDYTLNNIKKYATHIDESFSQINSNTLTDKQQATIEGAENMKMVIDSIEAEMEYLPDEYYYRLSPLVSSYHTDIDEFEKLALNSDFDGRDKFLAKALASLQQRQMEFRIAIASTYETEPTAPFVTENQPGSEAAKEDTTLVDNPFAAVTDTATENNNHVVIVETTNADEISTSNNAALLDTIHAAQQQIQNWINNIQPAIQKNSFSKVRAYANNISDASLKISDLCLLLKTGQKESLFMLANGLKHLLETLSDFARKGIAAKTDMQECVSKIKIKFSTLSTGINFVQ